MQSLQNMFLATLPENRQPLCTVRSFLEPTIQTVQFCVPPSANGKLLFSFVTEYFKLDIKTQQYCLVPWDTPSGQCLTNNVAMNDDLLIESEFSLIASPDDRTNHAEFVFKTKETNPQVRKISFHSPCSTSELCHHIFHSFALNKMKPEITSMSLFIDREKENSFIVVFNTFGEPFPLQYTSLRETELEQENKNLKIELNEMEWERDRIHDFAMEMNNTLQTKLNKLQEERECLETQLSEAEWELNSLRVLAKQKKEELDKMKNKLTQKAIHSLNNMKAKLLASQKNNGFKPMKNIQKIK